MTQVYGARFRYRPPEEVVEEVKTLMRLGQRKFVYFVDDIFNAHRKHAFAVMEGLMPLKVALDLPLHGERRRGHRDARPDARSGCLHINIGMESVNPESLHSVNKKQNHADRYNEQFAAIRRTASSSRSTSCSASTATPPTRSTPRSTKLIEYKAPLSFMFILSPRVGLKIRDELLAQGRIDHSDWDRYHSYEMRLPAQEHDPPGARGGLLAAPSASSTRSARSPDACSCPRTGTRSSRSSRTCSSAGA